jgi:hypothetical protein
MMKSSRRHTAKPSPSLFAMILIVNEMKLILPYATFVHNG